MKCVEEKSMSLYLNHPVGCCLYFEYLSFAELLKLMLHIFNFKSLQQRLVII